MLRWRPPQYESDRHVALCGQIEVGAVFPPCGGKYWRWRCWVGPIHNTADGSEKTEEQAKAAVAMRFLRFLELAGLQVRPQATED